MRVLWLTLAFVFAGRLAAPSAATAQYFTRPYVQLTDAIVVGGGVASTGTGSESVGGGPEVSGLVELPITDWLRFRGEAGVGAWRYRGEPYYNIQGSGMRRYRMTASVIRSRLPISTGRRLAPYSGGGTGLYFYRFPYRTHSQAWGIHGLAGAEYLLRTARSRWILNTEVQIHVVGGPTQPGGGSLPMVVGHLGLLLKYRLP
jgi:hypothetical protein